MLPLKCIKYGFWLEPGSFRVLSTHWSTERILHSKAKMNMATQSAHLALNICGPIILESSQNEESPRTQAFTDLHWTFKMGTEHCIIAGDNGSGKSLLMNHIVAQANERYHEHKSNGEAGEIAASVSFNDHRMLLANSSQDTVADVLGGLDAASKHLIVHLGLFPVWSRKIGLLSTGQIRKVLLARCLLKTPYILALDQPFDALDTQSRQSLMRILSHVAAGLPPLLVDVEGRKLVPHRPQNPWLRVWKKKRAGSSLIISVNRKEEMLEDCTRLTAVAASSVMFDGERDSKHAVPILQQLFTTQLPLDIIENLHTFVRTYSTLFKRRRAYFNSHLTAPLVVMEGIHLTGDDGTIILQDINWSMNAKEQWCIQGRNGAGKSRLAKLVSDQGLFPDTGSRLFLFGQEKLAAGLPNGFNISSVSPDVHLHLLETSEISHCSVTELFLSEADLQTGGTKPIYEKSDELWASEYHKSIHTLIARAAAVIGMKDHMLRPFCELSHGMQRLAIIMRALMSLPNILVLDEIFHGLDSKNRILILKLLDLITEYSDTQLVLITHHTDEIPSCITKILTIHEGQVLSSRERGDSDHVQGLSH